MGWLDDFINGFKGGLTQSNERGAQINERLYNKLEDERHRKEVERQRIENLNYASDSDLFRRFNSSSTPQNEKEYIRNILLSRGYRQNSKGIFNR